MLNKTTRLKIEELLMRLQRDPVIVELIRELIEGQILAERPMDSGIDLIDLKDCTYGGILNRTTQLKIEELLMRLQKDPVTAALIRELTVLFNG